MDSSRTCTQGRRECCKKCARKGAWREGWDGLLRQSGVARCLSPAEPSNALLEPSPLPAESAVTPSPPSPRPPPRPGHQPHRPHPANRRPQPGVSPAHLTPRTRRPRSPFSPPQERRLAPQEPPPPVQPIVVLSQEFLRHI